MSEKDDAIESTAKTLCQKYLQIRKGNNTEGSPENHEDIKLLSFLIEDSLNTEQLAELKQNPVKMKPSLEALIANLIRSNAVLRREHLSSANFGDARTTVFVSYRRSCSVDFVRHIAERLSKHPNIAAEFDQSILRAGDFPTQLGRRIKCCHILLLVIRPETLQDIGDKDNWIRKELVSAIHHNKEIIPLLVDADGVLDNINWPRELVALKTRQGIVFKRDLFNQSMDNLIKQIVSFRRPSQTTS